MKIFREGVDWISTSELGQAQKMAGIFAQRCLTFVLRDWLVFLLRDHLVLILS